MKINRMICWLAFVLAVGMGCASATRKILPVHDEVLIYSVAYDLVYLRSMDALQSVPGWDLEQTHKEDGKITVRNVDYSILRDSDQRVITVLIKSLGPNQTSVELTKESQTVLGGDKLLKSIADFMSREV